MLIETRFNVLLYFISETIETLIPDAEINPNKDWEGDILIIAC